MEFNGIMQRLFLLMFRPCSASSRVPPLNKQEGLMIIALLSFPVSVTPGSLQHLHDLVDCETCGLLAGRKLFESLQEFSDIILSRD